MIGISAIVAIVVAIFVFVIVVIVLVNLCICWKRNWYKVRGKPNGEDVEKKHMVSTQFSRNVGGQQMNQVILKSHPNGNMERRNDNEIPYKTIDPTTHTYRYETDVKNSTKGDSGVAGSPASSREAEQPDVNIAVVAITPRQESPEVQVRHRAPTPPPATPTPPPATPTPPPATPTPPPASPTPPRANPTPPPASPTLPPACPTPPPTSPNPPPANHSPEVQVHIRDELRVEGQVNTAADLSDDDEDTGTYSKPYAMPPAPESRPPPMTPGTPPDTPTEGGMPAFPPPPPVASTSQEQETEDVYAQVIKPASPASTFKPDQDPIADVWRQYSVRRMDEIQIIEK